MRTIPEHPNVARYKRCDFGKADSDFYIFSEYCAHGSVRDRFDFFQHGLVEAEIRKYIHFTKYKFSAYKKCL